MAVTGCARDIAPQVVEPLTQPVAGMVDERLEPPAKR